MPFALSQKSTYEELSFNLVLWHAHKVGKFRICQKYQPGAADNRRCRAGVHEQGLVPLFRALQLLTRCFQIRYVHKRFQKNLFALHLNGAHGFDDGLHGAVHRRQLACEQLAFGIALAHGAEVHPSGADKFMAGPAHNFISGQADELLRKRIDAAYFQAARFNSDYASLKSIERLLQKLFVGLQGVDHAVDLQGKVKYFVITLNINLFQRFAALLNMLRLPLHGENAPEYLLFCKHQKCNQHAHACDDNQNKILQKHALAKLGNFPACHKPQTKGRTVKNIAHH